MTRKRMERICNLKVYFIGKRNGWPYSCFWNFCNWIGNSIAFYFREKIRWGIKCYERNGIIICIYGARTKQISLYESGRSGNSGRNSVRFVRHSGESLHTPWTVHCFILLAHFMRLKYFAFAEISAWTTRVEVVSRNSPASVHAWLRLISCFVRGKKPPPDRISRYIRAIIEKTFEVSLQ